MARKRMVPWWIEAESEDERRRRQHTFKAMTRTPGFPDKTNQNVCVICNRAKLDPIHSARETAGV